MLQLDKWVINTLTNSLTRSHTDTQLYTSSVGLLVYKAEYVRKMTNAFAVNSALVLTLYRLAKSTGYSDVFISMVSSVVNKYDINEIH